MLTLHLPRRATVLGTAALLFLVPPVTYWQTVFHRFGLRDDYAVIREAREEPGKVLAVCASQGRILFGGLLEVLARAVGGIDGLRWLRLGSVLGLGLLAVGVFLLLLEGGWRLSLAALLSAFLVVLPSAQVFASWANCVPSVLALSLAAAAFALAERGMRAAPGRSRTGRWLAAVLVLAAAALTYQTNSLFYVVPLAATLLLRREETLGESLRWLGRHLLVVGAALAVAFLTIQLTFATHVFVRSPRVRFETHWLDKLAWAARHVLPDALALSVLDATQGAPEPGFRAMVAATVAVVCMGLLLELRRAGRTGLARWLLGLLVLSAAAWSVSFLAAERWPTYRTLYALTGVWSVFVAASLGNLLVLLPLAARRVATAALLGLVLSAALRARRHTLELFALPQGRELQLMEEGVRRAVPLEAPRIFVVTATQADTSAPLRHQDEFGSVSIDTEWVAKEVLKHLMAERSAHRGSAPPYQFAAGSRPPEPGRYDVVIDMRQMRTPPPG